MKTNNLCIKASAMHIANLFHCQSNRLETSTLFKKIFDFNHASELFHINMLIEFTY